MTSETTDDAVISRANRLISSGSTMTIATAVDGAPWAAPVYYVNRENLFYFFSSPDARHIQEALASGHAACAIHAEGGAWQDIQGLQMSGKIVKISQAGHASAAIIAYVKKFPFVKTFFPGIKNVNLAGFMTHFHASLYCFEPDYIVFVDNGAGFGFRRKISKDALNGFLK